MMDVVKMLSWLIVGVHECMSDIASKSMSAVDGGMHRRGGRC